MFLPEQLEALNEAKTYLQDMRFKAPVRSEKKLAMGITENKYEMKKFQKGHLITINAMIQLQEELKTIFNVPIFLTYLTTQAKCLKIPQSSFSTIKASNVYLSNKNTFF